MRFFGIFSLIPVSVLLTISYFVLFANRKIEGSGGLKTFGQVAAVLLWVAAGIILLTGIYVVGTGAHPMGQMHGMMQ